MTPGKVNAVIINNETSSITPTVLDAGQIIIKNERNCPSNENTASDINICNDNNNFGKMLLSGSETIVPDKHEQNAMTLKLKLNDDKTKLESNEAELLGSLTSMSSPAVRTSARVIQKMKMDSIRPTTPPLTEKKDATKDEHHRATQKTPNQTRPTKTIWTVIERNLFFDALNEFGKDFESIASYINGKQKRKNVTDPTYKAKEHVRLLYYQTFTKIAKYLRFSDDVTKKVQELYALINYGEMRRKIPLDNQKVFMKLRELVYRGSVTVRAKGKNCRIKTPSCPALRKINQVEKWQEDIKLPAKVDVELKPADNESWYIVQSLAQNPRVKTSLPLQKRLISLIKTLQIKWRSREAKLLGQTSTNISSPGISPCTSSSTTIKQPIDNLNNTEPSSSSTQYHQPPTNSSLNTIHYIEPLLCIIPPVDAVIHHPYVNLTDFLTSYSICLNSYEERIEATVRGESLCAEHITNFKEMIKSNAKRQRHDSGSEKKSPDMKRVKSVEGESKTSNEHDPIKKSPSQDGTESVSADELTGMQDDKFERGFGSPTFENGLFEIDGITQMVESSSADEADRDDLIKDNIKIEQSDDLNVTENTNVFLKKDSIPETEAPTMIVPDCIKRNLSSNKGRRNDNKNQLNLNKKREIRNNREAFRPLINDDVIREIRKGWTLDNVGDITIGDLYIMFGQDTKVRLEYKWVSSHDVKFEAAKPTDISLISSADGKENMDDEIKSEPQLSPESNTKPIIAENKPKNALSNKLRQLLLIANMTEKTKKRTSCACGHYCDRNQNKTKKDEVFARSFISNKTYPTSNADNTLFRQPVLPSRSGMSHFETFRLNMNSSRNKQSRWLKARNNRTSKQVVVQRLLPLQPGITQSYYTTDVKYNGNLSQEHANKVHQTATETSASALTSENISKIIFRHNNETIVSNSTVTAISKRCQPTMDMSKLLEIDDETHSMDGNKESDKLNDSTNRISDVVDGLDENEIVAIEQSQDEKAKISRQLNDDPGIQSLMEISLPSPLPSSPSADEYFNDSNSQPPMSPMGILRESPSPADAKWFEENMNDFSLSSFLGHLDSTCDQNNSKRSKSPIRSQMDSSNLSTISETSIDYITKFEELAESMKKEANANILMQ